MKSIPFYLQIMVAVSVMTLSLNSCSKEVKDETLPVNSSYSKPGKDERPPAYYITQSEKLDIPANVALPANETGHQRIATYYAIGVQKYKAQIRSGSFPETYEWVFVAPRADLYDITNRLVGTHGAGPFWALAGGADSIFAQHFAPPRTAPSTEPNTIDWLLLKPKTGTTPTGVFADVDYIQRIATYGGKAPATLPVNIHETVEVPYTAIYRFSKDN